jgi:hypothetical protein
VTDWGPYKITNEAETNEPERVLQVAVPHEILDRAPQKLQTTSHLVEYWYREARKKIPPGDLRDNMALMSHALETHFVATQGKFFWQDLAIHLWKMIAACATAAEAIDRLGLIDTWVREKNFAALENFYRLTVEGPAQER